MADLDGDDEFPNDFNDIDFDNIPGLQAPTINHNPPVQLAIPSVRYVAPSPAASPTPSTGSDSIYEIAPSFLAAVDEIEARAIEEMSRGSDSSVRADPGPSEIIRNRLADSVSETTRVPGTEEASDIGQPRKRSVQSSDTFSTSKKGKRKADPQDEVDVRAILEGYETELTCPICCDILVGAQVANPCGHTCCGECGYGWLARNKYAPSCATCRSSLHAKKPLLPNYTLDNLVRQHIQSLARTGRSDWQEKGYRYIEWNKRVGSWKKQTAVRAAEEEAKEAARLRRRQSRYHQVDDHTYVPPWLTNEPVYAEDEDGMVVLTRFPRVSSRR